MQTRINIDVTRKQHPIDPLIFGQFIEFLGRCIDRGIFEPGSPLSDANGFRQDVLEKVNGLQPPILRFPGGTVVKLYHWMDGVGPISERKRQSNRIWGGVIDHAFGTNEFIRYCQEIGAEPFLIVNMTTGTAEEAGNWVEYCNGTGDTYYANLRRSHGFEEPHNVKFWGLGNEESAMPDIGYLHEPREYIKAAWEFTKMMKLTDRSIKLVIVGEKPEWNETVLDELHPICDYLSIHYYANAEKGDYASLFRHVDTLDKLLADTKRQLARYPAQVESFDRWYRFKPRQREIQIALDEWGVWQHLGTDEYEYVSGMEVAYSWKDALFVANVLHLLHRHGDAVTMATFAQMVNILAPIFTSPEGSFCQTIYHPLKLYREHVGNWQLNCNVQSEMLVDDSGGEADIACLDVSATYHDERGEVILAVVNRHPQQAVRAVVRFDGSDSLPIAEELELNCPSWETMNGFDKPDQVRFTTNMNLQYDAEQGYVFAPHSITLLKHRYTIV